MAGLAVERLVDALEPVADVDLVAPETRIDFWVRRVTIGQRPEAQSVTVVLTSLPVTDFAVGGRALENKVDVAFPAGERPVFSGEREVRPVVGFDRPILPGSSGLEGRGGLILARAFLGREDQERYQGDGGSRGEHGRGAPAGGAVHGFLIGSCRSA
jgi:hypothetical protein